MRSYAKTHRGDHRPFGVRHRQRFGRRRAGFQAAHVAGFRARILTLSSGQGCRDRCVLAIASGTHVSVLATADTDSTFAGWSGACSGTGGCDIVVDRDLRNRRRVRVASERIRGARAHGCDERVRNGALLA